MTEKKAKTCNIPYFGNGPYCYANSTAMLLSFIGESISPSTIEVLGGVGLSAFLFKETNLIFFSWVLPNMAISKALDILGFTYTEKNIPKTEPVPFEELKKDLTESPAIIGPLDMGYLIYNPNHEHLYGADHFVLAYSINDKEITIHDPGGFPCVSLELDQLKLAWQSDKIFYGKDFYQYWISPKRIKNPSKQEIYNNAIEYFKSIYKENKESKKNLIAGEQAILTYADCIRENEPSQEEIGHLTYFALPLGARRALDFASFFAFQDTDLSILKRKQAELFGKCQVSATSKNWSLFSNTFLEVAKTEKEFCSALLNKNK